MADLREPTLEERQQGLPTTKQEAIKAGLTRFIPADGQERIIRQYGSVKFPNGSIEKASSRKANRGDNTKRSSNTQLATPPDANQAAADKKMAELRSQGRVGHHNPPIANIAAGIRAVGGDIDEVRRQQYFNRFESVGVPLGHQPAAIQSQSIPQHKAFHSKLEPALYSSIKNAGMQAASIFDAIRQLSNQIKKVNTSTTSRFNTGSPMGIQTIGGPATDIMPPSQEGYGPGGIIRTIPTAHERL